ncbi:YciI family protein [Rhodospirillales bacterium]|nr:YciI family protein [Rhodospirillales bacterium]
MVTSKQSHIIDRHAALGLLHYAIMSEFTGKTGNRAAVLEEHLAYQVQLEEDGKLFAAGPLLREDGEMAGIGLIIVKAGTLDEAKEIANQDPFHRSGLRAYKIWPWKINEGGVDLKIRFAAGSFDIS